MSNHHNAHVLMRREAAYRKITFENEARHNCPFCGKELNTIKSMIPGGGEAYARSVAYARDAGLLASSLTS